jgi:predicted RNA-binding protein with PIN domain
MSLHFIIDGYNLLLRSRQFNCSSDSDEMSAARQKLIQFLEQERPQGSFRNRVTVVFDGQAGVIGDWRGASHRSIRVIFTEGESADDRILKLIEGENELSQTVIVTDDRELSYRARQRRAKTLPVKEFLAKRKREESPPPDLDPDEAREITQQLAKLWLGK